MTDYSNTNAYLVSGEILYRPETYYYPMGNDSKNYPRIVGAGRPQLDYRLSSAGKMPGNPFVDKTCFLQPPIVYMESVPFDPKTRKFTDTFFYKNHRFSPGDN